MEGHTRSSLARHLVLRADMASAMYCYFGSGTSWREASSFKSGRPHYRVGEASNPGPAWIHDEACFAIGTANPTGIRGKERELLDLPQGIWAISETHLSQPLMRPTLNKLKYLGSQEDRFIRAVPGAVVPLRARSDTAGTWSGVLHLGDVPSRQISCQWPQGEFKSGRVAIAQHWVGSLGITGAAIYGWSPGPTWPAARKMTNRLCESLTLTIVLNRQGCRFIAGDFNHLLEDLPATDLWRSMGWREVQELNWELHGDPIQPTCKGVTRKDFVLCSPELVALFQRSEVLPVFSDHAAVCGHFQAPSSGVPKWIWPMPGQLDWDKIQVEEWRQACDQTEVKLQETEPTSRFREWSKAFEDSLNTYVNSGDGNLPSQWRGRGQHVKPVQQPRQAPLLRASRHGDVRLTSDFVSRGVQLWFKQLRRLQALKQNLQRNSDTAQCVCFRLETWSSILRAKGFRGGFASWWRTRRIQLQGSPVHLERVLVAKTVIDRIFEDFMQNYRQFESWHLRQQREIGKTKIRQHQHLAFKQIRDKQKDYIDTLSTAATTEIMAVSTDGKQIQLEEELGNTTHDHLSWWIEDINEVRLKQLEGTLYEIEEADCLVLEGQQITCRSHCVQVPTIHRALGEFWQTRWSRHADIPHEAWERILAFGKSFLPSCKQRYTPISLTTWDRANARYGDQSARGPDGYHPRELQKMPRSFREALLSILEQVEVEGRWPAQLLTGFTACLAKLEGAETVGQFRPLVIFSAIYRSWSTAKARPLLKFLASIADDTQFGFLPGRESLEISFLLQGLIELMSLTEGRMTGLVTDIQKAFECIPRHPMLELALHIGAPELILNAWSSFHSRFGVRSVKLTLQMLAFRKVVQ